MDFRTAWIALGRDPDDVIKIIKSCKTNDDRAKILMFDLVYAKKVAKALMRVYHPDMNDTYNEQLRKRYELVSQSIKFIESETDKAIKKLNKPKVLEIKIR